MLNGLLRRNAKERMPFEIFFNHPFLQRNQPTPQQAAAADLPSPFTATHQKTSSNLPITTQQQQQQHVTANNNNNVKNGE